MYDIIIIGGGPAAVSAGIYAARRKLNTLLVCESWGGQVMLAPIVENYPGLIPFVAGVDLVSKMTEHLKKNELDIKEGLKAESIEAENDKIKVKAGNDVFEGKILIFTCGRNPKKLGFANEEEFIGRGVSYCATCDGPLFKDKEIAVIGGGNSGAATVLEMLPYAKKIYWIVSTYRALPVYVDKIKKSEKVEIIENARAAGIKGDKFVQALLWKNKNTGEEKELEIEGIFVSIGWTPNSKLLENMVELNEFGEVKIDNRNQTSVENIFAAGDVTDVPYKQLVVAAGEGAKAALSAYDYLLDK